MATRRPTRHTLAWAILVSLLVNHGLILPGAFLLLQSSKPAPTDPPVEVELVPLEPHPTPPPAVPKQQPRRRQRVALKLPKQPPPRPRLQPPKPKPKPMQDKPKPPPPKVERSRLKMVELNTPQSERAPENARFLSDKNRRVERETRARQTNLERDQPRPVPRTRPSPLKRTRPGTPERKVAQQAQRKRQRRQRAAKRQRTSPLLAMRTPVAPQQKQRQLTPSADSGDLPLRQQRRPATRPRKRLQLNLDHRSLDRIDGDAAKRQRELARAGPSAPKGNARKRWERIRSALENFIPEVQPGNQTALGTRANPFAVYIARMHREIHRLWGFGFLVDLDSKPDRHPLNDMRLWAMVELVVSPDGKVHKATLVRTSGNTVFDVAALDTVFSASPYPPTPRAIRSRDGYVYLHWRFHRNQRQCGTFGVDPYILTKPPSGPIDGDMSEVGRGNRGTGPRRAIRRLNRPQRVSSGGRKGSPHQGARAASAPRKGAAHQRAAAGPRAIARRLAEARSLSQQFARAFAKGDARAMARLCALPFWARGKEVTRSRSELRRMLESLVHEASGGTTHVGRAMTPMQARRALGQMPPGLQAGSSTVAVQATLAGTRVLLLVQPDTYGTLRIKGLNR